MAHSPPILPELYPSPASPPIPFALPLSPLFECKEMAHFRALQHGAVLYLLRAFWLGGARPLPTDDTTLALLAGLHARQWSEQGDKIKAAWRVLAPIYSAVYARTACKTANMRAVAAKGTQASLVARMQRGKPQADSKLGQGESVVRPLAVSSKSKAVLPRTSDGESIPARVNRRDRVKFRDIEAA